MGALFNQEEGLKPVCLRGHAVHKCFYMLQTRGRVDWVVGVAIDALEGAVRAYLIGLLRHSRFFGAPNAGMSSGYVRGIVTYAVALGVELALRVDSSWVAESPAEVALSGAGG